MKQVANCIVIDQEQILVLKKPKHGWYAIPGGKMEFGETIKEAVVREYKEETNLTIQNPKLAGVFTFTIIQGKRRVEEWMMYTFTCKSYCGELAAFCREGELEWVPINQVQHLPMAEGDRLIYKQIFENENEHVVSGAFAYTPTDKLIEYRMDS
ncbi:MULTISPECIES: 8-oxo-dGTP diphosphatase [Clostridia]|uniref:8-oxo-dGTP diphosphatase n=1 Tax=Clostridia TaxID=186801 RepID=UPI000EA04EE1|nr:MULTISPECIES: 8-oxo-dGTP diphosphatase [Clostridia]NBJ69633.1 8-oxo-dGTP diphosphatase [Roseburia sp. 1XD42-34]RKI78311.1 8-oxo-dGTP diphosphatase [Clostridium sp. 1xD42-85]